MAYKWISQLPYRPDGLFKKLASPNEGWSISDGVKDFDVPLGKLDETAYQILLRSIESNKKIAIALPRVKPGVSLSIIAYLVVNRFIGQHGRTLKDFHPIDIKNEQSIVIATQNRKLRDFFLLSSLRFSGAKFPFTHFPISRIKLTGELAPLVGRNEAKGQIAMNPIVFYHFDELDSYPPSIDNGYLLGELTETNSANLAVKLCKFIEKVKITSGLVLVNKYSDDVLEVLKTNGFSIITIENEDILSSLTISNGPNLPSLNSSLMKFPQQIALRLHLIEDKAIESSLTKVLQILMSVSKKLGNEKPRVFTRAWGIFYVLKDLCVQLPGLEQYRKRNAWLKTIKHNLQQTFKFPLNSLDERDRNALAPIWGTLEVEFTELYKNLEIRNPKFEYIKSLVQGNRQLSHCIVFSSQAQADVLKEELLIDGILDDVEGDGTEISFINDLVRNSEQREEIMLSGVWKKTDDAKIFSVLPKTIHVICYSSELPAFSSVLRRFGQNNASELRESMASLQELKYSVEPISMPNSQSSWIVPDDDSQLFIDYFKDIVPEKIDEAPDFDQLAEWEPVGEESEDTLLEDSENTGDGGTETIAVYKVILDNDKVIFIPADQDVMAYSEDGEIQSKLAETLEPGDVILLYSHEQNREMFENVIQRTQEISGVDVRVISLWKTALKSLREKYDIKNPNSLRAYLHDLERLNCQKTEQASKMWLKGTTLAPRDQIDIETLLQLVELKNVQFVSKLVHREIEKTRIFHRVLGRRLKERLSTLIRGENAQVISSEPLEREIDEILEMAEPTSIREISKDVIFVQKSDVKVNVLG